jgi:hypothetical protein
MLAPVDPSIITRGINHNMEKSGHAIPKREEIKGTAPRGGLWNDRLNRES